MKVITAKQAMKNLQLKKECFEMTKEEIINLIDNRIKSEYEKIQKNRMEQNRSS